MKRIASYIFCIVPVGFLGCGKKADADTPLQPVNFSVQAMQINGQSVGASVVYNIPILPQIKISFAAPISKSTVSTSVVQYQHKSGTAIQYTTAFANSDSTLIITLPATLSYLTKYRLSISTGLQSRAGGRLLSPVDINFVTQIDSSKKFPVLTDNELLDKIQRQTFKYFWDFGHPVSGLARERNTSGETVTSGGSGFGIMSTLVAIHRGFITKTEGLARLQTTVSFLKDKAQTFHGAYPHWLNGTTGAVIPFSTKDNGADLVETGYLVQGLLCARQFFNAATNDETNLRNDINTIYNRVEWDWFRNNGQNVLYWHWSPNYYWEMNHPIRGWDETLITYVLAAASPTHSIPTAVYNNGWKSSSNFINGSTYYGYQLPLGPSYGGPLFFSHYSFLGIDPNGLTDASANYTLQTKNHTLINYQYCKANPRNYFGYSDSVWGLTASDIENGYTASSPTNDVGVIAPTAALSSFPYTPAESMAALKFFYYVLGDKLWKDYGFIDAFSLHHGWFASSFLAIDQGPIIVMIENHRSGLLWKLLTGCPEIKTGMKALGFSAQYL